MLGVVVTLLAALPWAALADCPTLCRCSSSSAVCSTLDPAKQIFDVGVTHVTVRGASDLVFDLDTFPRLGLTGLASLDVVNSSFQRVHVAAFSALPELTRLNLTRVDLKLLHPDMFANNSRLETLSLRGAPLRLLEQEPSPFQRYLLDAPSLTELDLRGCSLGRVGDHTFARMTNVEYVDLGDNGLREVGATVFDPVESLLLLDLADNLLERLTVVTDVATLVLDGNPVSSLRGVDVAAVDTLHASRCRLRRLNADELATFPQLTNLYVRDNELEDLHEDAFFGNIDLQNLDLSRNRLRGPIPSTSFRNNSGLSRISLADNPTLGVFVEGRFEGSFPMLSFLDLSRCGLLSLHPDNLAAFDALKFLRLAGNQLTTLQPGVVVPGVVSLDLSDNRISRVASDMFPRESKLKKLKLSRNPLHAVDAAAFVRTSNLRELELRDCGLTSLWSDAGVGTVEALRRLLYLDVADNAIRRIAPSELASAPELDGLDVAGNPLDCSPLEDLVAYLVQQDVKVAGDATGGLLIDDDRVFVNGNVEAAWKLFSETLCGPAKTKVDVSDSSLEEEEDDDDDEDEDEDENAVQKGDLLDGETVIQKGGFVDGVVLKWVVGLSVAGLATFLLTWAVVWLCHRHPRPPPTRRAPILRRHRASSAYETLYEHLNSPTTPVMTKHMPAFVGEKTPGADAV